MQILNSYLYMKLKTCTSIANFDLVIKLEFYGDIFSLTCYGEICTFKFYGEIFMYLGTSYFMLKIIFTKKRVFRKVREI